VIAWKEECGARMAELADAPDSKFSLRGLLKSLVAWAIPLSFLHDCLVAYFAVFASLCRM